MKKSVAIALAGVLSACSQQTHSETPPGDQGGHWLVGCWRHVEGETKETWINGFGDLLFGHSVTTSDGKLRAFEDLRIQPDREGGLIYVASPGGAAPVSFKGTVRNDRILAFENPDHDYPQRIQYEKTPLGLTATISKLDGGDAYAFAMTSCMEGEKAD